MNIFKKVMPSIGLVLMLGIVLLAGCSRGSDGGAGTGESVFGGSASTKSGDSSSRIEPRGKVFFSYFDTVSYVYSYAGDGDELFDERTQGVADVLDEYHRMFDIYYEYSGMNNLCTVNRMAGEDPVEVSPKLIEFLLYCKEVYELTDGMVDVMMGSVLSLWHDARTSDEKYLPAQDALDEAALHVGFEYLEIDEANNTVRITDPDASIDVGAIGKGYATEKAAKWLEDMGAYGYVLNIGGNVRIVGTKPNGDGWVTGIKDPKDPDSSFALRLKLSDCSCVTSGEYERFFTVDGVRYSHIIDPKTLWPAQYFASLSVITKDSGYADALSTALYCMSYEDGLALVDALGDVQCVWVFHDGEVRYTEDLESLVVR